MAEQKPELFENPPVPSSNESQAQPPEVIYPQPEVLDARRREAEIFSNVQYILEPRIPKDAPKEFITEFTRLEWLVSKNMALANIEREDIVHYMDYFQAIVMWLKFKRFDVAARRMIELIMELQLTRSIRFGERIAEISTRMETVTTPPPVPGGGKKTSFWKFWE